MKIGTIGIHPPRLPKPTDVHVLANGIGWSVRLEAELYNHATYATQTEALGEGMRLAREAASMLMLYGRNGSVRDVRDYSKSRPCAD